MEDSKIIEALVVSGALDRQTADLMTREAPKQGKTAEELLYSRQLIPEETVAKVKSQILKLPYKKVDVDAIKDDLLKMIPGETANTYKMVPLSFDKKLLVVGMVNPDNLAAQEALRFLAKENKINLGVYLITPSDADRVLKKYSFFVEDINAAIQSLGVKPGQGLSEFQRIIKLEEGMSTGVSDAPVIRIVASMFKEAVNLEASDLHIEPQRTRLRVRFRIDGELQEALSFPAEIQQQIVSRVKVLSSMKLDETRVPQDGRFRTRIFDREIDFRVATFPTPTGEKVAIRVLDSKTGLKSLDDLGVVGKNLELLKAGIDKPYGMILLTGPTGSGKTTTLYALLQILNKENVNIVSLEDPVEYTVDGVNQSQVHPEIGYDFASGLREILRQDPDVIMVGEIRDSETAGLAVHAALTGHVVLSTLHTNNSIGIIPRLVDMGVQSFLLPSVLNVLASQRLITRLCQKCKKSYEASPTIADIVRASLKKVPVSVAAKYGNGSVTLFRSPGCAFCKQKGVVGRVALFEVFQMTPELSLIVTEGATETKILAEAKRQETIFLREDGVLKALEGLVSIEEVIKETAEV